MTCSPNWPEIRAGLIPGEEAQNRSDLVARAFRGRHEEFKNEILKEIIFGDVAAYLYVMELQKRGLPHAHWIIILQPKYKITSPDVYDHYVSAELPNAHLQEHLHACVVRHIMHGPCGLLNPSNMCMRENKCKNKYLKDYAEITSQREDSYPLYRRRNDHKTVHVRGHILDNRWVVPYNPYLLAKFDGHINVEICVQIRTKSKISNQLVGYPALLQLHVHLPNHHHVSFPSSWSLYDVIVNPNTSKTQLTEFFSLNANSPTIAGMSLLYKDFPRFFVWNATKKIWHRRVRGICIVRLVSVSSVEGERYYLRMLLNHIHAPTSFEFLRMYNGILYPTFQAADLARGLLESDIDAETSLTEASSYQMPYSQHRIFATILIYNTPYNPRALWSAFKSFMADDYISLKKYMDHEAYVKTLQAIDSFLQSTGRTIDEFGLVDFIIGASKEQLQGQDYEQELNYPV